MQYKTWPRRETAGVQGSSGLCEPKVPSRALEGRRALLKAALNKVRGSEGPEIKSEGLKDLKERI